MSRVIQSRRESQAIPESSAIRLAIMYYVCVLALGPDCALSGVIRGPYLTCRRVIFLGDRLTTDQFGVFRNRQRPAR